MSGPPLHLPAYRAVAATLLLLSGCGEYGATAVAAPTLKWQLDAFGHNSARIRVAAPGQADVSEPITSGLLPVAPFFGNADHGHDRTPKSVSWRDIGSSALTAPPTLTVGNIRIDLDVKTGLVRATRCSDGVVVLQQTSLSWGTATTGARHGSASVTAIFNASAGEMIYGLGEHKTGTVLRMPFSKVFADSLFYGRSQGADVSIPFYTSSAGYGFIWNLPSLGSVDVSESGITWVSNATLGMDVWITTTPMVTSTSKPDQKRSLHLDLLRQYADAVGHPTPMPAWSTGFVQCKDRYRNQSQVLDVARGYVERGLPISMIVIDWFHWVQMGDFKLNPACFPDPIGMVEELRDMGIELMITLWPFIGQNVSTHWQEYEQQGFLANSTATGKPDSFWRYDTPTGNSLIDSTNDAAMRATFRHWYEGYGQYGVRALWLDEAEPDHADVPAVTRPSYISGGQWRLHKGIDAEVLPSWVYSWTKGFSDGMHSIGTTDGQFFVLSRNAWLGTASHGAALWSGDIGSSWDELRMAITAGQGVGMSGIPLWTTDIGGYHGGDPRSPDFQQLIVRWFQFGAFCPIFRLHGHRAGGPPADHCGPTNGDNEVWNLAAEGTVHYSAIAAVMRLREDLRDYVQRLNNESVATGVPMMRPMFLEFPGDAVCVNNSAEQQFMLGDAWLVAPVVAANASSWPVYLPALSGNHQWVYWWNQTVVQGPGWFTVDTGNIAEFPLFFRRPVTDVDIDIGL